MKDLTTFLSGFVHPLVAGGELQVGLPIDLATVARWEVELGDAPAPLVAIDAAREAVAAELVVRPPPLALGVEELRLAVALYDSLVLVHPDVRAPGRSAVRWLARGAEGRVRDVALTLARADPPEGRTDLLSRHGLLHNLFDLRRVDTTVQWWTGKAEFRGMRPPTRLVAWPGVRRVREEHVTVPFHEILAGSADDEEARGRTALVSALLDASPLTDLLHPARSWPPFRWRPCLPLLADAELARAIAYSWLAAEDPLRAPAAATLAWERLVEQKVPAAELRAVTAFLVHLAALVAVGETRDVDLDAPSARLARALGDGEARGAHLFLALPDVASGIDGALAAPPGIDEDPRLSRRWKAHRKQVRGALDVGVRADVAEKLAAALSG